MIPIAKLQGKFSKLEKEQNQGNQWIGGRYPGNKGSHSGRTRSPNMQWHLQKGNSHTKSGREVL